MPLEVVLIRKLISKNTFFSHNEIPKVIKKHTITPLAGLIYLTSIVMIISIFIHIIIFKYWPRKSEQLIITTYCARYVTSLKDDMYSFESIPYSLSPTFITPGFEELFDRFGDIKSLRWSSSVPLTDFETCSASHIKSCEFNNSMWLCKRNKKTRLCNTFDTTNGFSYTSFPQIFSENCLFLSIKIPKKKRKTYPVIVFLTGSNNAGDLSNIYHSNPFIPRGKFINRIKAIFVTINYRRGLFGSFYNEKGELVNFGVSDVLSAFKWIKNNIRKFGGDSKNIVLLAHGTGSTIGLSCLLHETNLFRAAWLSSGSVYIPYPKEFHEKILKKLYITIDKRCISKVFMKKYCGKYYSKLLRKSYNDLMETVQTYYRVDSTINHMFKMKPSNQPSLIFIDDKFIYNSPHDRLIKSSMPNIPIVFSNMLCELDGFPGSRELFKKTSEALSEELLKIFEMLFKNNFVSEPLSDAKNMLESFKNYTKRNKKTLAEVFIEIMSFLRVTCPYNYVHRKFGNLSNAPTYHIVHNEVPSQIVNGMFNDGSVKRFPFYGFDIVLMMMNDNVLPKLLSYKNKLYQKKLLNLFYKFVHDSRPLFTNKQPDKFQFINHKGLHDTDSEMLMNLCNMDYSLLIPFLNKIN